ncbi:hypothetical protein DL763_002744 [Monosporascus cannonballus]|nr:hypothetical protein DL763_002744 [Monosporascus cannonballus]
MTAPMIVNVRSWLAGYSQSPGLVLAVLIFLVPLINYAIISIRSQLRARNPGHGCHPPDIPYWIPFFGHILSVAADQSGFLRKITFVRYGIGIPVAVKIGPLTLYLLTTPEVVMGLTKTSEHLTPKPAIALAMKNIFGTHTAAGRVYMNDDPGIGPKPLPGSTISPIHRIWFHQSSAARKYLSGSSLKTISEWFMEYLTAEIARDKKTAKSSEWVELPDLYEFWKDVVFVAALNALYGPYLVELNSQFIKDFWSYNAAIPRLMMGFPRWLTPGAYAARDRVLYSIKKWHRFALERSDITNTAPEWDEEWGSAYLKVRYKFRSPIEHMDADAHAADDLALLVAANANAVMCSAWFILETLREPGLIPKLLAEIENARKLGSTSHLDIDVLCSQPLLQSMYAETLRLRIGLMINRTSQYHEVRIGPWKFPPNRPIAISNIAAATNPRLWGDRDGERSLNEFWAERFFLYPNDKRSGPWSAQRRAELGVDEKIEKGEINKPTFTMDGMSGGWIPYGAGEFMCPGRHLAKQEMVGSFAVFLDNYDVEVLLPDGWVPEPDMRYFGTGALPPKKTVPFRIRRRVKS